VICEFVSLFVYLIDASCVAGLDRFSNMFALSELFLAKAALFALWSCRGQGHGFSDYDATQRYTLMNNANAMTKRV